MLKEFKNVTVNYEGDALIKINEKLYKIVDGEFEECTVREIIERNITGTTIKKCKIKLFFTGNLQ